MAALPARQIPPAVENDEDYGDNWRTDLSASSGAGQVISVDDSEVFSLAKDQEESLTAMETSLSSTEPIVELGVAPSERRNISLNVVTNGDKTIVHLVNYNFEQDPGGHPSTADTATVTDLSITQSESGSRSEIVILSLQTWCFVVFE